MAVFGKRRLLWSAMGGGDFAGVASWGRRKDHGGERAPAAPTKRTMTRDHLGTKAGSECLTLLQ